LYNSNYEHLVDDANNRFYSLIPHTVRSGVHPRIEDNDSIEVRFSLFQKNVFN